MKGQDARVSVKAALHIVVHIVVHKVYSTYGLHRPGFTTRNRCLGCIQPASNLDAEVCTALKSGLI